jgi:DNA polymerase/3'-5' exonuclease PolX
LTAVKGSTARAQTIAGVRPVNDNLRVAERLAEAAWLLRARGASVYSVRAYKRAGDSIAKAHRSVRRLYRSLGVVGLDALPNVGLGIASDIGEMLETGHWTLLDRLRAEADPETLRKVAARKHRAHEAPEQLPLEI